MSSIVTEMIVEKLDQVILLLQVQKPATAGEENWTTLKRQLESIRQGITDQQLEAKKGANNLQTMLTAIAGLETQMKALPGRATVEHKHHLHKGIWISAGLLVITILLSWQWLVQIGEKELFRENGLKYRYLKVYGSKPVKELCNSLDSFYLIRENDFEYIVIAEEKRVLKLADSFVLASKRKSKLKNH